MASQDDGGKGLVGSGGMRGVPFLDGRGGLRLPVCHPERSEGASFGSRSGLGERSFGGFAVSG